MVPSGCFASFLPSPTRLTALLSAEILHTGKHYVITFSQVPFGDFTPLLHISTDAEATKVRISAPRKDFLETRSMPPYSSLELALPPETRSSDNGIGDYAVKVESETEVSSTDSVDDDNENDDDNEDDDGNGVDDDLCMN